MIAESVSPVASHTNQKPKITAVIKAKNESRNIGDCIDSIDGFADEILVVDDHSDDDTVEIALHKGARVISGISHGGAIDLLDLQGFKAASGEWLLRFDADERMVDTLAQKLLELALNPEIAAVVYARQNVMFGGVARHGGWFRSDQCRFFRKTALDFGWDGRLHSQPSIFGQTVKLPLEDKYSTIHLDYDSVEQFAKRTLVFYALEDAKQQYENGVRVSLARVALSPARIFFGRYIVRSGYRDGYRGLFLASFLAIYDLIISAHLWDLERQEAGRR